MIAEKTTKLGKREKTTKLPVKTTWTKMKGSSDIILSNGTESHKLIFNETILLLLKTDSIKIRLPESANEWWINFHFIEDDLKKSKGVEFTFGDNTVDIHLNKWYDDTWLENVNPYFFEDKGQKVQIYVKIRTTANTVQAFRSVTISIWQLQK